MKNPWLNSPNSGQNQSNIVHNIQIPKLYPWQREALDTPKRHRMLICSRRAGKTQLAQIAAIKALLRGHNVMWVAPIFSQVVEIYRTIANTLTDVTIYKSTNKEIITYSDAGRPGHMWFRSGDNPDSLRSLGYDLVIFDEFCFSDESAWKAIRPALTERQGRFLAISSPNGHNFAYTLYEKYKKSSEWFCVQHPWSVSPHLKPEEIAKAEAEMLPSEFRQEYLASFESPTGALFDPSWLRDIFLSREEFNKACPENERSRSIVSIDNSLGHLDSDYQAVVYMGVKQQTCYVDCWMGRVPIPEVAKQVKRMVEDYKAEGSVWENVGFQSVVAESYIKLFEVPPHVLLLNNTVEKDIRISRLASLLSQGRLKILDNYGGRLLHSQLCDWPIGKHDDGPDALEMAWRTLTTTVRKQ